MIDYRIQTFLTLYREMNYRKTAELLGMTQPGVTQHIHFLEKAYGTRLFSYDGKALTRTRSADLLKMSMERILAEEQALTQQFQSNDEFLLKIGATKTIGEYVILPTAEAFLRKPNNRLELVVDNTAVLLELLSEGRLDLALIEGSFDKNRYGSHLYKTERFVGICAAHHPFAGKAVSLERIFRETLFLREEGSGTRGILEQLLRDANFSLDSFSRVMTVNNFAAIRRFVASGLGITFAYRPISQGDSRLAAFEIQGITVIREFNYVYLNRHIAEKTIRRFEGAAEE